MAQWVAIGAAGHAWHTQGRGAESGWHVILPRLPETPFANQSRCCAVDTCKPGARIGWTGVGFRASFALAPTYKALSEGRSGHYWA
jgi:hypothetical protein